MVSSEIKRDKVERDRETERKHNENGFQTPLEKKTSRIAQGKREREAKRSGL